MMKHRWGWIAGVVLFGTAVLHDHAWAARSYEVTGTVERIDARTLRIMHDGDALEFDRSALNGKLPKGLKAGDQVTIRYELRINAVKRKVSGQMPGRLAPGTPGHIDDRAFYTS
jgi:hypothetical protein